MERPGNNLHKKHEACLCCNLPLEAQFSIPYNRSNTKLLSLLKLWHNHALAVMWCVNWYKMIKSAFPVTYRYLELMVLNNKLTRESIPTKTLHPWMKKQSRGSNQHGFLMWSSWYNQISPMIQFCTKVWESLCMECFEFSVRFETKTSNIIASLFKLTTTTIK